MTDKKIEENVSWGVYKISTSYYKIIQINQIYGKPCEFQGTKSDCEEWLNIHTQVSFADKE